MILDLLYISIILVFILDISGFTNSLKNGIAIYMSRKTQIDISPDDIKLPYITCSLCSIWWTGIIYLIFTNNISLYGLALVAIYSMMSSVIMNTMQLLIDLLNYLISKIYKKI